MTDINNMTLKCTLQKPTEAEWIHLQSGKEFSRLLYTNPVCFLATTSSQPFKSADSNSDRKAPAKNKKNDPQLPHNSIQRNVMVLSWLTASNNNGRFLFSIHKERYSAQLLTRRRRVDESDESSGGGSSSSSKCIYEAGVEFSLSVPVKGMEEIVKDVGSISGRCCSKFQSDETAGLVKEGCAKQPQDSYDNLSNRQRKKQKKENIIRNGILGLVPVPLGSNDEALEESSLFAIKGTVAHMRCRVCALLGPQSSDNHDDATNNDSSADKGMQSVADEDHLLIMAEVVDAYVHSSYWDSNKMVFRPMPKEGGQMPPYLTFFGSQTFGYVVPSYEDMM